MDRSPASPPPSSPSSAFARRVADLDGPAFRAFVADVWRARGRTVDDSGDGPLRVRAPGLDRDDAGGRTLAVVAGDDPVSGVDWTDVDVVVTGREDVAAPDGVTLVGPAALRRRLLYALDRSSAAAVCDRHLDGVRPEPDAAPAGRPADVPAGRGRRVPGAPSRGVDGRSDGGPDSGPGPTPVAVAGRDGARDGASTRPGDARDGGDGDEDAGRPGGDASTRRIAVVALVVAVAAAVVLAAVAPAVPALAGIGVVPGVGGDAAAGDAATATPPLGPNGGGEAESDSEWPTDDGSAEGGGDGAENGDGTAASSVPSPEEELRAAAAAGGSSVAVGGPAAAALPPGVAPDGTVDEATLAAAHAAVLANTSYRATLTHRERVGGEPGGLRRETIAVESPTRFAVDVETYGTLVDGSMSVAEDPSYAVGGNRTVLVRPNETYTYGVASRAPGGPIAARLARLVEWFLSVEESRIVYVTSRDGRRYYALAFANDTYAGVENATGTALVDERGVVHELRRSYDYPTRNGVRVTVTVRLSALNRTTADPPAWYGRQSGPNRTTVDRPRWYDRPTADDPAGASASAGTGTEAGL